MHEQQGQDRDKLFELVKKCFLKDGPLGKVFNTNNLKISYKTLPNMKQTISAHHKKTTNKKKKTNRLMATRKTRNKYMQLPKEFTTPLPTGRTLPSKTSDLPGIGDRDRRTEQTNHKKLYGTGLGNHEKSFNHRHYSMETKLSTHIWELRQRFRMVCEVENL